MRHAYVFLTKFNFKLYLTEQGFRGHIEYGREIYSNGPVHVVFLNPSDIYDFDDVDLSEYPIRYVIDPYKEEVCAADFSDWYNVIRRQYPFLMRAHEIDA